MSFIETKSLLAKLLATENLTVEHRKVDTASFDTKNRILTLPLFAEISSDLADLLVGHEVGHALETPESLLQEIHDRKINKSVFNVIEDVRIERKIKTRYPGLRNSFIRGYQELILMDFFGIKGIDLNQLNFIDRVNMFHKGGAGFGIKFFNDTENDLLKEINQTETPKDVIAVTLKVIEYLKKEKEEKEKQKQDQNQEQKQDNQTGNPEDDSKSESKEPNDGEKDREHGDREDSGQPEDSDEEHDKPNQNSDNGDEQEEESDEEDKDGSDDESENSNDKSGDGNSSEQDEVKSITDEEFHKNENKLFDKKSKTEYYYGNIPKVVVNEVVVDYKTIWSRFKEFSFKMYDKTELIIIDKVDNSDFQKVRVETNKVASYLAKEFEMRKNADQMKRTSVSKTGELNMSKIYSYKFSDDIFKKMSVVTDGKSHGLVIFVDWSGSMSDHINGTIKQLLNLTMFCKKVSIPFEVYAFTSGYDDGYSGPKKVEGQVAFRSKMSLLNILSNRMSANDYSYACAKLLTFCNKRRRHWPGWFHLDSTPLNECIVAAMEVVPHFQKMNKLQVVNTVFLTDGEGHDLNFVWRKDDKRGFYLGTRDSNFIQGYGSNYIRDIFVLRDPVTKHEVKITENGRECTSCYLSLLKARTNSNIIGYYILTGREFNQSARQFFRGMNDSQIDSIKKEFRRNKYQIATSSGYDEYYLLRSDKTDDDDDEDFVINDPDKLSTRGLVSAFRKYSSNRATNRVVLNRFIGLIT